MMTAALMQYQDDGTGFAFPDSDGDGIQDRKDQCVDEPENFNGYLDWDGCPEVPGVTSPESLDSDYDGILDTLDSCPQDRENYQ